MNPTPPTPRVTTEKVERYLRANMMTGGGQSTECRMAADLIDARERIADLRQELSDLRSAASGVDALYTRYAEKGETSALMGDLQVAVSLVNRMLHYGPEQSADADRLHEQDLKMWQVLAP